MRAAVADDGFVVVMDEAHRGAVHRSRPARGSGCSTAGASPAACRTDSRTPGSVGTGTVMRPDTLRRYAADAGFATVDVLPVQDDFFRFYGLRPAPSAAAPDDAGGVRG